MIANDETQSVASRLLKEVKQSKKRKDSDYVDGWQRNVDERRGKSASGESDENRSMVPMDWTITKTKSAQLFSQLPEVRLIEKNQQFAAGVPVYARIVNDLMKAAAVGAVVSECVVDVVNAAGIGAAIVRYEALSEPTKVPAIDTAMLPPDAQAAIQAGAFEVPMMDSTRITARRFTVDRISPADLLWPDGFRISNWNKAPWLGHTAREPWAVVKRLFNLTDEQKDDVVGAGGKRDKATLNNDTERPEAEDLVEYDEVFYWRYRYHEDEAYYDAIQRVVYVQGLEKPVVDEPWAGQKFDEQSGSYLGSCLLPIRVLVLEYISDQAVPPSDSAVIRPLVMELQQARQDMKDQRKHSKPLRGFDVDKIDPANAGDLINGTWNGMIPTIGPGDRAIWEIARSSYPRENHEFDAIYQKDIEKAVSVGPNQSGQYASGERSASEARIVQDSFQTEIGQRRAHVAAFVASIAEVLGSLWALYGVIEPTGIGASIGPQGMQRLESLGLKSINQKYLFDVRADLMVKLDAQSLLQQLTSVLNVTAQSGFINPKPLIRRIVELNGLDPDEVMVDPTPKGPEPPKMSYSFKGEDLLNPLAVAILAHNKMLPSPDEMAAAEKVVAKNAAGIGQAAKAQVAGALDTPDAGGPGPEGPVGPPAGGPPPQGPEPIPAGTELETQPTAFPQWEANPRINTRRSEG